MLCALSGEAPEHPVVSTKSGNIFEKRLIEAYVEENGKDPITFEDLSRSDLIHLKTSPTVKPRPPTLTSIPSLLSVLQNEWDALALETFALRQHLTQTRQELSNALYENDAAKRVIARLQRERDEARDALAKGAVNGSSREANGDAMQIDGQELSPALVAKVEATQEKLSKTRRKRPAPDDWATPEDIQAFAPRETSQPLYAGARHLAVDAGGDLALFGGTNGTLGAYSVAKNKLARQMDVESPVTDALWAGARAIAASSSGDIHIFDDAEHSSFSAHQGAINAIALHPSGDILASVGEDKAFSFYDLSTSTKALRIVTDSALTVGQFHPDGHLFAAGGADGQIKLFDTKTCTNVANFDETDAVESLHFSENGTWLAVVTKGSTTVSVWDLRKSVKIKELDMGGPVVTLRWDYTGQYLAAAGPRGLTVQAYDKGKKEWSVPLSTAAPAVAVEWGMKGKILITVNAEGVVTVLGGK